MSRPPLGTRWGDLSPEERAALPVGTLLAPPDYYCLDLPRIKRPDGLWYVEPGGCFGKPDDGVDPNRTLLSYPDPDPRNSDGPVDEGGGEMRTGDNDTDGDVPEVAREVARLVLDYGGYAYTHAEETQTERGISTRYSGLVRLYWPPTCEGAEDAPRDCLP